MNYTKGRLLKKAQYWEGASFNDLIEKRNPTPMITIEMTVDEWDKIWQADAAEDMYEALKEALDEMTQQDDTKTIIRQALAKYEGREK